MENYEILSTVGEGSYGVVMKCRHKCSKKIVAIKKLTDFGNDNYVKKMILREVRILKKLRHENLVRLFEVFKKKRRFYLVFEYLEKTVLDDLEKNPKGLDEMKVLEYLYQIIRAIEFCHSKNVIHRDIKPENLLVSSFGILKLCDFGCARVLSDSKDGIYTEYVATRWYRAPELLVGYREYGKPVDIWAIGCVFAEMLTGQPLFPGQSDVDQLYMIIKRFGKLCPRHQQILNSSDFNHHDVSFNTDIPTESEHAMNNFHALHNMFQTWSSNNLNFAALCLHLDPEKRPPASELLKMGCFKENNIDEMWFTCLLQNNKERNPKSPIMNELILKCSSVFNSNQSTPRSFSEMKMKINNTAKKSVHNENLNTKAKPPEEKCSSPSFLIQMNSSKTTTFKEMHPKMNIYQLSPKRESVYSIINENCSSMQIPQKSMTNLHQSVSPLVNSIKNSYHRKQENTTTHKYKKEGHFKQIQRNNISLKISEQNLPQENFHFSSVGNLNLPLLKIRNEK